MKNYIKILNRIEKYFSTPLFIRNDFIDLFRGVDRLLFPGQKKSSSIMQLKGVFQAWNVHLMLDLSLVTNNFINQKEIKDRNAYAL